MNFRNNTVWRNVLVVGLAAAAATGVWWLTSRGSSSIVTSFDECVAAGYPVAESFPRVCRTPEGGKFVEPKTSPSNNSNTNSSTTNSATNTTTNSSTNSATNTSTTTTGTNGPHFGMNNGVPRFADQLDAAGAEVVRVWIRWSVIEASNNQYNWTEMDQVVSTANGRDIDVLGYFYDQPRWSRDPDDENCNTLLKTRPPDPCAITDWAEYEDFAKTVAERYDGNHGHGTLQYIGIWNEVQGFARMDADDYKPWLERGYRAVKEGNPNATVLIGSNLGPLDFPGAADFIDVMLRDESAYYDIFDFHIYQTDDNAVGQTVEDMKSRMERFNVDKPIWLTETAQLMPSVPCNNLAWQGEEAQSVIRRYAQALGNGVDAVFWYAFEGVATIEEDASGLGCGAPTNFSLGGLNWLPAKTSGKTDTVTPRPAYTTFQVMTGKLAGYSAVEKITDTQYKFTVNGRAVYVLWCDTSSCSLPSAITGRVTVTDYLGSASTQDASDVSLTSSPVFIE